MLKVWVLTLVVAYAQHTPPTIIQYQSFETQSDCQKAGEYMRNHLHALNGAEVICLQVVK